MCERVDSRHGISALAEAGVEKKAIGIFMDCSVYRACPKSALFGNV
jgi:hypothetical protein